MFRNERLGGVLLTVLGMVVGLTGALEIQAGEVYDQFGYEYASGKFNGLYENADRDLSNNTGVQTELQMEWNREFNITQPEMSANGAWVKNSQRGAYIGEDGKTYRWNYSVRILYTGPGSPLWQNFTLVQEVYHDGGDSPTPKFEPPVLPIH